MDMAEIEREIRKIEADRTTWNNCERLSILYTVRDHQKDEPPQPSYSFAPAAEPQSFGDSEFLSAVVGVDAADLYNILDEHMEAVKMVFPKEYSAVIRRIKELPRN